MQMAGLLMQGFFCQMIVQSSILGFFVPDGQEITCQVDRLML